MSKLFIRTVCMILAVLMSMSAMVSCANNDTDDIPETSGTEDGTTEVPDDVPEFKSADFGGEEFKFLIYGSYATDFIDEYIWSDGVSGGTISDAVAERNRLTEEKYDVTIVAEEIGPDGWIVDEAELRLLAGQCDFDVIYDWGLRNKKLALDGMLYDFLDLENIDMDQSYWLPSTKDDLIVGGRMFVATNYITMNGFSWANFLFFNKDMMTELEYAYTPYDYVYANCWTFDAFMPMILSAEVDVDGDQKMGPADQYGYMGDATGTVKDFIQWSGQKNTIKNDDGITYTMSINTDRARAIYETYKKKLDTTDSLLDFNMVNATGADTSAFTSIYVAERFLTFGEGHTMFMSGTMDMTKEFVNMQDYYGVVPNPKYDTSQEEYYHWIDACAPMLSIPYLVEDPEMTGIILEYMAYESEQHLLPAYYETTVKTKRMEDNKDYEMLDIIRDTVHYDWTMLYLYDQDIVYLINKMVSGGHFASVWKRYEPVVTKEVEDIIDIFESIE